ncbi:MAG: group II intron reverse transcriptase/maturase [Pleurocapsa sp. MO_192.B19]|nr:group II intron reverse transcriptase/maturase [Pleurocapsa sp. MO_192.B19]
MSKTDCQNNTVEWNQLDWRKIHKVVFKLQKRIYRAYVNGDVRKGRRLQKTLIKSYYNRLLSIRKVSQDNQGKKTAGVDKVKSLTPKQRLFMAENLVPGDKAKPIRRVWIPKPGKKEQRPLGIPVMRDRAVQALVKTALEPEWEAKFEPNSYGFRPGRGAHDAIGAIFNTIRQKSKYVLDADIAKCFDKINHKKLLEKLNTFPKLRRQVRAWLRADICDFVKHERTPNQEGTPQGGVISPLLANIALHGMEKRIKEYAATWKGGKRDNQSSLSLIRYADDFLIIHENLEVIEQCQKIINDWLAEYDLELKPEKTRIAHTLKTHNDEKPGFNFLGFNIRQYPVGKYQSGKNAQGKTLGFKTLIKPSDESIKRHYAQIAEVIRRHNSAPQEALISKLNPIIRGWSNYYKTVCSKQTYSKVYHLLFQRLLRWAYRRHPNKNKQWVINKYWKRIGNDNWVFGEKEGLTLIKHQQTAIIRHIKVKGESSPYDGNKTYWGTRKGKHPELNNSIARLLKKQKGKCNWCDLTFHDEDKIEKDHITPKSIGGNIKDNLQLLHRHCHDEKTKEDLKAIKRHKAIKEYQKFINRFNKMNWKWIDDIPTLVGTHKEPERREAV